MTGSQLRYTRTGGFGGLKMVADLDTSTLDEAQASSLEQLVDDALAEAPPERQDPRVRDGQHHELTIIRDGGTRTLRSSDPVSPPALTALINELSPHAKPTR